jgi:hypothetical protein
MGGRSPCYKKITKKQLSNSRGKFKDSLTILVRDKGLDHPRKCDKTSKGMPVMSTTHEPGSD